MTTLYASQGSKGMSGIYVGVTKAKYSNSVDGKTKPYFGIDFMGSIDTLSPSFFLGVGFDLVGIDGVVTSSDTYGNYTLSPQLKVGYSLSELVGWNINLKADYGYGVSRWEQKNYWGSQYSAALEIKLFIMGYMVFCYNKEQKIKGMVYAVAREEW